MTRDSFLRYGNAVALGMADRSCPVGAVVRSDEEWVTLALFNWLVEEFTTERAYRVADIRRVEVAHPLPESAKVRQGYPRDKLVWDMDPLGDFQTMWEKGGKSRSLSLTWYCHECRRPITDGAGSLVALVHGAEPSSPWTSAVSTAATRGAGTLPASCWRPVHTSCHEPAVDDYSIDIEQVRSVSDFLLETVSLMSKQWFAETDWRLVTSHVAAQIGDMDMS